MMECFSCSNNDQFAQLPPHELIAADSHWRIAHAFDTSLPGWLVLIPRRHVNTIAELTDAEATALGSWQVRLSRALHQVTGCAKTYVMQFAERDGFGHVHFHIVPRMPDIPPEYRGPSILHYLGQSPEQRINGEQLDHLAAALRDQLTHSTHHRLNLDVTHPEQVPPATRDRSSSTPTARRTLRAAT